MRSDTCAPWISPYPARRAITAVAVAVVAVVAVVTPVMAVVVEAVDRAPHTVPQGQ
jgi:hypothetical protein